MFLAIQNADPATAASGLDVLSIVVGIGGTVLGAVVGIVGTLLTQRQQLKHQDRTRFHDKRLEVYGAFLESARAISVEWVPNRAIESLNELAHAHQQIELVGPAGVRNAADVVAKQAADLYTANQARDKLPDYPPEYQSAIENVRMAMRSDLGIDP